VFDDQTLEVPLRSHAITSHHLELGEPNEGILRARRGGELDDDSEIVSLGILTPLGHHGTPEETFRVSGGSRLCCAEERINERPTRLSLSRADHLVRPQIQAVG
jgi:hypothetical protein